jgi:hypothetical protein
MFDRSHSRLLAHLDLGPTLPADSRLALAPRFTETARRRARSCAALAVLGAVVSATGCGSSVRPVPPLLDAFEVTPLSICAAENVTASWRSNGEATSLSLGGVSETVAANDTRTRPVFASGFVAVTSTRGDDQALGQAFVEVLADGHIVRVGGGYATCVVGDPEFPLRLEHTYLRYGDRPRVGLVTNNYGRRLRIEHDGRSVVLGPDETTAAFADDRYSGTWVISASLIGEESCAVPGFRRALVADTIVACR